MATGWLRGTVKSVESGDTLVVIGAGKIGGPPPPEKRLTLSSLIAPKLGKRDGSTKDEPFAWESKEYLRKKTIGQPCVFKVDYVVEQLGNREFGTVFIGQQENIALAVVGNGWAKVRALGKEQSPYIEDLKKAEEAAQARGVGVWSKDLSHALRSLTLSEDGFNAQAFLNAVGKGRPVDALVDAVLNGSTLRVYLADRQTYATVVLAGVQAPSLGRRLAADTGIPAAPEGDANGAPAPTAPGVPSAAAIAGTSAAEPLSREAKYTSEMKVLNRDVKVILEGIDKYNNLFANVIYTETIPPPPGAENGAAVPTQAQANLAETLVQLGQAKCVEWSLNMMTNGAQKLRDLERQAKQERKGMWSNYVAPASNQAKLSDIFTGKVVEVVSGDCLVVKDASTGLERRINLSSIRAPRPATRDRPSGDPWSADAKEFLRRRLVGKQVEVKMEYTRKVMTTEMLLAGDQERVMAFGNVDVVPEKGEEKQNVAEMTVARGFASVIRHRSDEERSGVYDRLLEAEELAKSSKRGIYSNKEPAVNRVNDVSAPGNAAKAKQHLPFLQRAGKMQGVVEAVLSGSRLKVHIPKEGATIVFAPAGIKTPSRAMPAGNGRPAVQAEPYADEAIAFTREHMLQRDVEVAVETCDRGGTFLGTISILAPSTGQQQQPGGRAAAAAAAGAASFNLSLALLKAGLARLQPQVDPGRLENGQQLLAAQDAAKAARLRIWQSWTPEQDALPEADENGAANGAGTSDGGEVLTVVVTEVADASEFFVQVANEPRVAWIAQQLDELPPYEGIPPELRGGQLCLGQFSLDKKWYRAYVERVVPLPGNETGYEVYFIDFGNRERLTARAVRPIDTALAAVPPQAVACQLAYIKVPAAGSDYSYDAKAYLSQIVGSGQPLVAHVVARERPDPKVRHPKAAGGKLSVTLVDQEGATNVAVELLIAGLATLPKLRKIRDPATRDGVTKLLEYEDLARKAHRGMFQYGDPGDSDDEVEAPKPKAAWGKK